MFLWHDRCKTLGQKHGEGGLVMKKGLIAVIVALTLGVGGLALAHGPGGSGSCGGGPGYGGYMMGPGYGRYGSDVPAGSNLSPEQAQKLQQLRQKQWQETQELRQQLFSKHEALRGLYTQPNPDREAIQKLEKEIFDLKQQLREKHFAFRQEARTIDPQFRGHRKAGKGRFQRGSRSQGSCWNY